MDIGQYYALKDQHDATLRRWALSQSDFRNAHFETEGTPWIAEDFMGTGDRIRRKRQQMRDKMQLAQINAKLMRMRPGDIPDDLPEWARP